MLHKIPLNRSLLKNELRITSYINNNVFSKSKTKQYEYILTNNEELDNVSDMVRFKLKHCLYDIRNLKLNLLNDEIIMTEEYINYFYKNH
jgi:hypothetical protein